MGRVMSLMGLAIGSSFKLPPCYRADAAKQGCLFLGHSSVVCRDPAAVRPTTQGEIPSCDHSYKDGCRTRIRNDAKKRSMRDCNQLCK